MSAATTRPWKFDFTTPDSSKRPVVDPPGYVGPKDIASKGHKGAKPKVDNELLKVKKAWDVALAPGKQLPMQGFMLWMSGNTVQIFSVAITAMLMFSPIRALMNMSQVFERYETVSPVKVAFMDSKLALPKLTYVAMQILTILLGMWKLNAMGLLPTSHSDWLAFLDPKTPIEYAL
ncbi:ER membrane protein complex subunit 4 [Entomortierella parvispora]|uniref:ER membrane protein complex subunit 4 n=1 Tax=Entomortierella parvispora TaxID=205924 RepID=A0A9P3H9W9_9FUNG|nr:ER membrane protein complex subunit 4 [Entomortierella parvispora]